MGAEGVKAAVQCADSTIGRAANIMKIHSLNLNLCSIIGHCIAR